MRTLSLVSGMLLAVSAVADETGANADTYFPQKLTAQGLLQYCASSALSASGRSRQSYCSGFVSGVEESVRLLDADDSAGRQPVCVPAEKPARYFRDVYIRHASKQDTDLTRPAALVVLEALEVAHPCGS